MTRVLVFAIACGSSSLPEPSPHVSNDSTDPPYATYDLVLPAQGRLRLPATGGLRCSISPEGAFTTTRSGAWIEVESTGTAGWSMLRLLHESGARSLYRFHTPERDAGPYARLGTDEACDGTCYLLDIGEQAAFSTEGVRSYSEGTPGIIDIRVTSRDFVFIGLRPGRTTVVMLMRDGTERVVRLEVREGGADRRPEVPPVSPTVHPPAACTGGCEIGSCVEGLCASWRAIDC